MTQTSFVLNGLHTHSCWSAELGEENSNIACQDYLVSELNVEFPSVL